MAVLEEIAMDALAHMSGGAFVAILDYSVFRLANDKGKGIEKKKECLEAMSSILAANSTTDVATEAKDGEQTKTATAPVNKMSTDSVQYAINVNIVKSYLIDSGIAKKDLPLMTRIKSSGKSLIYGERINNMSTKGKLWFSLGMEILYDTGMGWANYTQTKGQSPVTAIANNIYQVPAFWLGLVAGKAATRVHQYATTSSAEKKMDKTLVELQRKTNIVDLALSYVPTEKVQEEMSSRGFENVGATLSNAGKKMYTKLGKSFDNLKGRVTGYSAEKTAAQEAEVAERKSRFDELTKGR